MIEICAGYTVRYPAQDIRLDILKLVWYRTFHILSQKVGTITAMPKGYSLVMNWKLKTLCMLPAAVNSVQSKWIHTQTIPKQYTVRYRSKNIISSWYILYTIRYSKYGTVPWKLTVGTGRNLTGADATIHLATETEKATGFYSEKACES